jgi:outer membrane protein
MSKGIEGLLDKGRLLIRHLLLALLLGCGLVGCAAFISQKKEISIYRKVIDDNKPAAVTIAPDQVVTLTDALKLAVQNEEQLSIQGETYLQALIAKDEAFAAFLPTLSFGSSWEYVGQGGVSPRHAQVLDATVPGQWNIFNGFRDYYNVKATGATIEQQKQLVFDLEQTVLLDVAQAYYAVLTSEQSVDVLTNSLAAQESNVRTLQEQFRVGTARPLDVAQAESLASQTRVQLLQAQADVKTGRTTLAFLVNAPIRDNPLRDDFEAPADVGDAELWIVDGEDSRQDLKAAQAAVRAARYTVEVEFGQYYPSLTFNLGYDIYSRPFQPFSFWSTLLNLNVPIFTGGLIEAQVRNAWSLYRTAALTESQLRRSIDETVRNAYINLGLARDEVKELEIQVIASRDEYNLSLSLYQNGGGTYLNVQQAQATLLSAQLQLTTEQFARKTAYFNLLRTVGQMSYGAAQSATRPSEQGLRELATQPSEPNILTEPSTMP